MDDISILKFLAQAFVSSIVSSIVSICLQPRRLLPSACCLFYGRAILLPLYQPSSTGSRFNARYYHFHLRVIFHNRGQVLRTMDWAPIITAGHGVWQWGVASSNSLAAFSAALPTECKSSLIHTFGICSGARPLIFPTPGFSPFSLAWGWFLVGTLIGILVMLCMYIVIGWFKKVPPATIYTLLNFALENTTNPGKRRLSFFF